MAEAVRDPNLGDEAFERAIQEDIDWLANHVQGDAPVPQEFFDRPAWPNGEPEWREP